MHAFESFTNQVTENRGGSCDTGSDSHHSIGGRRFGLVSHPGTSHPSTWMVRVSHLGLQLSLAYLMDIVTILIIVLVVIAIIWVAKRV